MPTSILSLLSNLASAFTSFLGFQSKKLDLKNSAAMQQAKSNAIAVKAEDKTNQAIANKDTAEIEKEIAE